jgi:hypothetical protein
LIGIDGLTEGVLMKRKSVADEVTGHGPITEVSTWSSTLFVFRS